MYSQKMQANGAVWHHAMYVLSTIATYTGHEHYLLIVHIVREFTIKNQEQVRTGMYEETCDL